MALQLCGLAGGSRSPSRTRALVELAATRAAARFGAKAVTHGLADLQPSPGRADALVVGSPVHEGSHEGLLTGLKRLFDLIGASLAGRPVPLTATGGGDRHTLAIGHRMRPLLGLIEAATLPMGVHAGASDLVDGRPAGPAPIERLARAVERFSPWLGPSLRHLHQEPETAAA